VRWRRRWPTDDEFFADLHRRLVPPALKASGRTTLDLHFVDGELVSLD